MPKKAVSTFEIKRIACETDPIVEITGEGTCAYVWFNRDAKYARTITRSTWPVLNIDISDKGEVIGVEAVGFQEFTLGSVIEKAGLKAPASLVNRARYIHGGVNELNSPLPSATQRAKPTGSNLAI